MAEALLAFLQKRWGELDTEEQWLRKRIERINAERETLRKAAEATGLAPQAANQEPRPPPAPAPNLPSAGPARTSERTIKDAVMEVLETRPGGMKALDILDAINARLGTRYVRTSLSPQLSRLKADGRITLEGKVWRKTDAVPDFTEREPDTASETEPEEDSLFR